MRIDSLFLRSFLGMILTLIFNSIANGSNILFHEEVGNQAVIYSMASDGTNLEKIGQGLSPQCSPDRKFISYIEPVKGYDPTIVRGLVVTEPGGKEVFRIGITGIVRYRWAPDSNGIALVTVLGRHQGTIAYYDIKTRQIKPLHKVEFKDLDIAFIATTLEWSPNGRQILFSSRSLLPKGKGVLLIDIKDGATKNLSDEGTLPGFVSNKVLFAVDSEIWTINLDGSDKKRLFDVGMPIISLSKIVNNKIILQINAEKLNKELPFKLYLLNLDNNKMNLKEINSKNHLLLCPNIAPDGNKFTAIGMRLKKDGQFVSEEESELGYYVFDIKTEEVTLLKRFEDRNKGKGFWWGIYGGYGNHTSWN